MDVNEWDLYPSKYSKCEFCQLYIGNHMCWRRDYISVMMWSGSDHPKYICEFFKTTIENGGLDYIIDIQQNTPEYE